MSDTPKRFPIQSERGAAPHPMSVSWETAELAYSVYAGRYGRSQSLKELAERGGFGPGEMDIFLPGWRDRESLLSRAAEALRMNGHGNCQQAVEVLAEIEAAKVGP